MRIFAFGRAVYSLYHASLFEGFTATGHCHFIHSKDRLNHGCLYLEYVFSSCAVPNVQQEEKKQCFVGSKWLYPIRSPKLIVVIYECHFV